MTLLGLLARGTLTTPPTADDTDWTQPLTTLHVTNRGAASPWGMEGNKGTYRRMYEARRPARSLVVETSNIGLLGQYRDTTFRQAIAIERLDGSITPATYAGQHLVTVATHIASDPIQLDRPLAEGERFWIRTYRESDNAATWPRATAGHIAANGDGTNANLDGADLTTGGEWPQGASQTGSAIDHQIVAGETPIGERVWANIGDSITEAGPDPDTGDGHGFFVRAAARDGVATVKFAQGARALGNLLSDGYKNAWFGGTDGPRLQYVTDVFNFMGRNDIAGGGATFPTGLAQGYWAFSQWLRDVGVTGKIYTGTITPRTNSTDGWKTIAGQTHYHDDRARVLYNDWLRDGAPYTADGSGTPVEVGAAGIRFGDMGHPMDGMWDLATAVETGLNTGIWRPNLTLDGIHPWPEGHAIMADVVPNLNTV